MIPESQFAARDELISKPQMQRPHVVVLGAGASVASCPAGDKNGRYLPTMDNLVEVVGLGPLLVGNGIEDTRENFETLYSTLHVDRSRAKLIRDIEAQVHEYFMSLELPESPTAYDHLLLSLRKKDAIFTFNWDPFLYDAYVRNRHFHLPEIFFLHGNVRAAYCSSHPNRWAAPAMRCSQCATRLVPTKLLYPVKDKNYAADQFIASQWEAMNSFLSNAFTLTIYGYGAPVSDVKAVEMMNTAWHLRSRRLVEHVEIIDVKSEETLYETWKPFISHFHYVHRASFYESWIASYPRRSSEALFAATTEGRPAEHFSIPKHLGFDELYEWLAPIARYENT